MSRRTSCVPCRVTGFVHNETTGHFSVHGQLLAGSSIRERHADFVGQQHEINSAVTPYQRRNDAGSRQKLGTNVLILDPKTIILQSRHVQLQQDLQERGFRIIPLDFSWHTRLDGAFRCATTPYSSKHGRGPTRRSRKDLLTQRLIYGQC